VAHLGLAEERADRVPPTQRVPAAPYSDTRVHSSVGEHPVWTYDSRAADPPLMDPLTI